MTMKRFSFRPSVTLRGRTFKGLRGWAGKPLHPPLTDIPVAAYVLGAAFDVISVVRGEGRSWGEDFWRAATFTFVAGALVSVLAAITGIADWSRSSEPGTQARRTINAHAAIMITVTVLTLLDLGVRLPRLDDVAATPAPIAALSVVIAALVSWGSVYGGALVYEYGFNVETAGDSPVWHPSEQDVFPGGEA